MSVTVLYRSLKLLIFTLDRNFIAIQKKKKKTGSEMNRDNQTWKWLIARLIDEEYG